MAQLWETEKNVDDQNRILDAVSDRWGVKIERTPVAYHFDGVAVEGKRAVAAIEVRRRNIDRTTYPTFVMSMQKFMYLQQVSRLMPMFFVIEWDDGMFYTEINNDMTPSVMFMRQNMARDERDFEPCVEIDVNHFLPL